MTHMMQMRHDGTLSILELKIKNDKKHYLGCLDISSVQKIIS